jgi:hypothetical protein
VGVVLDSNALWGHIAVRSLGLAAADPARAVSPALWVAIDQASMPSLFAVQSALPPSTVDEVTDNRGRGVLDAEIRS